MSPQQLAHQWHAQSGLPVVFLHGLLGSQQDWQAVIFALQNANSQNTLKIRPLTLDLPFHGESAALPCADFSHARTLLHQALTALIQEPFVLVGYSLGGRLALDYTLNQPNPNLAYTLLEGANIGLKTDNEKAARWQNDQHWANRFRTETIENVLADWYQQPVFAHLTANKRSDLIEKRRNNHGSHIAQMLESTSLAKQPDFSAQLPHEKIHFLIGEQDQKFRQMAAENHLPHTLIPNAGHNSHAENPSGFVGVLNQHLQTQHF